MAGVSGNSAALVIGTTDVSAYCTDIGFEYTRDSKESSTFGDLDKEFVFIMRSARLTVKYEWDKSSTAPDALLHTALSAAPGIIEYYPESKATGANNIRYSAATAGATKNKVDSRFDDIIKGEAEFQISGAWTRAVVA